MMGGHEKRVQQCADLGIQFMLTGHSHIQDVSYAISEAGNIFYDLSTPALCGYPGTIRMLTLDPAVGEVRLSSDFITEPVALNFGGRTLQEHFETQFIGMIRDVILAAGSDINRFADMATAFSVKKKLSYRIGWLIKGPAKFLANLKIGTVGNWTRAETGLSKADYASIKEEKALDFIISLVLGLYGGDAPYTPDTPYYKITCGMLNIIDSILRALHINLGKLVKGANSVRSLVEPLLYNAGVCDEKAVLPIYPVADAGDPEAVALREAAKRRARFRCRSNIRIQYGRAAKGSSRAACRALPCAFTSIFDRLAAGWLFSQSASVCQESEGITALTRKALWAHGNSSIFRNASE